MKLNSVRSRLTLWNVIFLAFVLGCFTLAIHYTVGLSQMSAIDRDMNREVDRSREFMSRALGQPAWFEGKDFHGGGPDRHHDHDGPPPGAMGPMGFGRGGPGDDGPPGPPPDGEHHEREVFRNGGFRPQRPWGGRRGKLEDPFLPPGLFDLKGKVLGPKFSAIKPWSPDAFKRSLKGESLQENIVVEGTSLRLYSLPYKSQGKIMGVIQIARPLGELNQLLSNLDRTLLVLILPALLVAGLSGAFLTDRSLRPVKQISQAASQLGVKDLSLRLPVKGNDEFSELAGNFNRMTERMEGAFKNLEAAYSNLEEAYERQRRFTADASHELRTPLTTIKANTSFALSGEEDVAVYREALEEADSAANSMARIVEDLLFLARSDNNGLRLEMKTLPARRLLESAVSAVREKPDSPPVEIVVPDPNLQVSVDPHHVKRLLLNLIENAIRHTPSSGTVTVSAEQHENSLLLKLEDTGDGIAAEHLPHIFERFYRVDSSRSREDGGAGLGLSICESIVTAHGGTIEMRSRQGEGTVVAISLPDSTSESIEEKEEISIADRAFAG